MRGAEGMQGDPSAQRDEGPAEPPYHEGVARAQLLEHRRQLRPLRERARGVIREYALDADSLQGVVLQRRIVFQGRDACVAEPTAVEGAVEHGRTV